MCRQRGRQQAIEAATRPEGLVAGDWDVQVGVGESELASAATVDGLDTAEAGEATMTSAAGATNNRASGRSTRLIGLPLFSPLRGG
jgi:hypothetical protein